MGERPDETLRKWEEVKEQKKNEGAIMKLFAKIERRPRPKPKPKGKKKMRWEGLHRDWGFILLLLIIVMVWSYAVTSCSSKCPRVSSACSEVGHGICPHCEIKH